MKNNHQGSALLISIMFIALLTMLAGSYLNMITDAGTGTQFMQNTSQAFYAAEAGVHRLMDQMNNGGSASVSGTLANTSFSSSYSASYDSSNIVSTASVATNAGTATRTVTVRVKTMPTYVRGAVTANGDAIVKNNAILDGRDHDANGNLTGDAGTYGVSSTGTVTEQNSGTIGGNGNAPANPAIASSYQQNASALSGTNPWDLLGVTKTWFDGHVANTTTAPTTPFSGITYYTPKNGKWMNADLNGSSGILIVHNSDGDAQLKDFTGTFKGLIISDEFMQAGDFPGTVVGAVMITNLEKQLGGSLNVKYSSSVLTSLGLLMSGQTTQWKKIISTGSWTESQ